MGSTDAAGGQPDEPTAPGWRDDVVLMDEMLARHPDLTITHEEGWRGRWYATWTGSDGTEQRAGADRLGQLLDRIGAALASRQQPAEESP